MIYRKLDANGDYTFGQQAGNFWVNQPEAVAQALVTVLGLIQGEWFLDPSVGVPYDTQIIGMDRMSTYDQAIQEAILGTQGVNEILAYVSGVNTTTRKAFVACTVGTIYGQVNLSNNDFSNIGKSVGFTFSLGISSV